MAQDFMNEKHQNAGVFSSRVCPDGGERVAPEQWFSQK
jgi:hypothetical protein